MVVHCHNRPFWDVDDFSKCFQHDYLQTLLPLLLLITSVVILAIQLLRKGVQSRKPTIYRLLKSSRRLWKSQPLSEEEADDDASSALPDIDDEIERNAKLALHPTLSQTNRTTIVEADRPRGESFLVLVEILAVLTQLIINTIAFVTHAWGSRGNVAAVVGVAFWGYILVLVSVRFLLVRVENLSFSQIWYHTAYLYGLSWIIDVLLFRSYIIHPPSTASKNLMIIDFSLLSLLTLIALISRKGNRIVEVEWEGELEPPPEQTASVLSLATFGWLDPLIWKGYQNPIEMKDVYNIMPRDKAAVVLANYRQTKKTSKLAWHLLKYFKGLVFQQAAWAAFSGFLTFAPTLLLRSILQYVEAPQDTPRNSAWFFVALLFVSGCCSALADGQALWIGRRTCNRLRAIIVGELYSKALKRKAGAHAEKILGEEKLDVNKAGFIKKFKSLGRKQKKKPEIKVDAPVKAADADSQVTSGAIINLMAVDSFKVAEASAYLHFLWATTPVQFVVCIILLYKVLGLSSLAGIAMIGILLPANMILAKAFSRAQKRILAGTDARIHATNEVLTNIRIIKYFAWEQRFMNNVDEKRKVELHHLRFRYILWGIASTTWSAAPALITLITFAVYTLVEKKDLIPSVAFTALSLFQILRLPLDQLADMVAHVQEAKVSVDRIEEFLSEEDTDKYEQLRHNDIEQSENIIGFDNATFTWGSKDEDEDSDAFRMLDLDMRFQAGQLNVIVGPTGSGKTSLLMALLGEMTKLEGHVYLSSARSREDLRKDPETGLTDSVAYCAQQAWLVNGTVKENILFASPWDEDRYTQVIQACSLRRDFEILDEGDDTLVGEKGVTLSGGQKQRISLARALYCTARHILLDDVLSAVDSHTARHIFNNALMGPLMSSRTCILVTHNISLTLPHAAFAVVLENGRVTAQGSAAEVTASGALSEDLAKSTTASRAPSRLASAAPSDDEDEMMVKANGHDNGKSTAKSDKPPKDANKSTHDKSKHTHEETKAVGAVKFGVMLVYLRAMGRWYYWIAVLVVFVGSQLSSVSTNVWITYWADAYAKKRFGIFESPIWPQTSLVQGTMSRIPCLTTGSCFWNVPSNSTLASNLAIEIRGQESNGVDEAYYLSIYALLAFGFIIVNLAKEATLFGGSLVASKNIHQRLIESVSRAKFRFFDSTPLGQIMNRFSKDIENIDQEVAPVAIGFIHCLASIVTIVILISAILPGFLVAGLFISILYFFIGRFYINASRDLKRLESIQRSPIYQQFGETLAGMITIRAYGDERRFIRENLNYVNTHTRPFFYVWASNRWLAFRVDVAGALVSFFAGVFVVLSVNKIDPGAAGLAMTYAVTFTENVLWFVRLYATNEQNMNSVERVKEYLDVEQEAPAIIPDNRPAANWPSHGEVEFIGYSTRYRKDFDPVLKNISFRIAKGEKVGIVGRTGAGKSSLALALFRALEAEDGKILIDNVDIGLIGLQDLRENVVMVPQDPTLFSGTIRSNLDPFDLFTDEEIFDALRRVYLIGSTSSAVPSTSRPATPVTADGNPGPSTLNTLSLKRRLPGSESPTPSTPTLLPSENKNVFLNLMSTVAESGSNMSQGQRQLLCLARALLKDPKVLLMDEATASIDYTTDTKIQETIRDTKGGTIITIAHRLRTIIDYDKVLVLDHGRLVEMGSPWELLRPVDDDEEPKKRWFKDMCADSGELAVLELEAKKSFERARLVDDGT